MTFNGRKSLTLTASVIVVLLLGVIAIWGLIILLSNPIAQAILVLLALAGLLGLLKRAEGR